MEEEEELCIVCHKNKCVDWCFWCKECLDKEEDEITVSDMEE